MFERLQQIAVIGIFVALLWIGWELHALRRGSLTVDGLIDAKCHFTTSPLEVQFEK